MQRTVIRMTIVGVAHKLNYDPNCHENGCGTQIEL